MNRICRVMALLLVGSICGASMVCGADRAVTFSGFGGLPAFPGLDPERIPQEYRSALWEKVKTDYLTQTESALKEITASGVHFDRLTYHLNHNRALLYHDGELLKEIHRLARRYGISLLPILNVQLAGGDWEKFGIKDTRPHHVVYFPSGFYGGEGKNWLFGRFCPNDPDFLRVAADYVERVARALRDEPDFDTLALDDEANMGYYWATGQMACVHPATRARFEKETGMKPPGLFGPPPGTIVSSKTPLHRWIETIGVSNEPLNESMARYAGEMRKAAQQAKADLRVIQYPGLEYPMDGILWELYSQPAVMADMEIAKVRSMDFPRKRPTSMLIGWFTGDWLKDKVEEAGRRLYLNGLVCLTHQVADIGIAPTRGMMEFPPVRESARQVSALCTAHGAFFRSLSPVQKPVALLYSETARRYQFLLNKSCDPWRTGKFMTKVWPVLRTSHIPIEVVGVKQVLTGGLDRYAALLLPNVEYATEEEVAALRAYAAKKPVFAQSFPNCGIPLPGAKDLNMEDREAVRAALRQAAGEPPVDLTSPDVFYELLEKDKLRCLCVINPTDSVVETTATIRFPVSTATDYFTNTTLPLVVQNGAAVLSLSIPAADWRVLLLNK